MPVAPSFPTASTERMLVQRGNWRALLKRHICPAEAVSELRVTVRPGSDWALAYLYPLALRKELLSIPIPLRKQETNVLLDLQQLLNDVYNRGRYAHRIDTRLRSMRP